jgi:hypothetical protein
MIVSLCRGLCYVPTCSDFNTFRRLENIHVAMPAKHNHASFGVRPEDHYISFINAPFRSVLHFAKVFPSKAPLAPDVSHVYPYPSPLLSKNTHTQSSLIYKQVVPYRIHGGTCCHGESTPKNQSLADSS